MSTTLFVFLLHTSAVRKVKKGKGVPVYAVKTYRGSNGKGKGLPITGHESPERE
jgi:hypothetical protein